MVCHSDNWLFRLLVFRTIGFSDQWCVGILGCPLIGELASCICFRTILLCAVSEINMWLESGYYGNLSKVSTRKHFYSTKENQTKNKEIVVVVIY